MKPQPRTIEGVREYGYKVGFKCGAWSVGLIMTIPIVALLLYIARAR